MKIHELASQGDCDGVRRELRRGASVDSRDVQGLTPLACAASSLEADEAMPQLLIDAGADVNAAPDELRQFPIGLAISSGDFDKARVLLQAGADINAKTAQNYNVFIKVVYSLVASDFLLPAIEFMATNGADLNCITEYGESALKEVSRLHFAGKKQHHLE